MKKLDLQHGDVILYDSHKTFIEKCIRLVTGNRFTHVAIIQDFHGFLGVFEQLTTRRFSSVDKYTDPGTLYVYRPKFTIPKTKYELFYPAPYAQALCLDHLINHGVGRLITGWQHRKLLSKWIQPSRLDCGYLVATCLNHFPKTIPEPDDFYDFEFKYMGELEQ